MLEAKWRLHLKDTLLAVRRRTVKIVVAPVALVILLRTRKTAFAPLR
jgi:hypothetical protein